MKRSVKTKIKMNENFEDTNGLGLPPEEDKTGDDFELPETGSETEFPDLEGEPEAEEADVELAQLEEKYEDEADLSRKIEDLKRTQANLTDIRKTLGVEDSPDSHISETNTNGKLEQLKELMADKEKEYQRTEKEYMEVPDGEGTDPQISEMQSDLEQYVEERQEELDEIEKAVEAEIQKMREEFVEKYVERSVEHALEWMDGDPYISRAENLKKGKKLMAIKVAHSIRKFAQRFIKEGGRADLGWQSFVQVSYFKNKEGEDVPYITDIKISRWSGAGGGQNQ